MNLHQHLEEQLKEDFKLLKEYEEKRRYAIDPREEGRYSNEIQKLRQRISERETEIQSLKGNSLSPQALIEHYLQADSNEIEPADIRKIEQALQSNTLDASMLPQGCRLLRKEKGLDLVINQLDWIYELALIADGDKPRRQLLAPKPTNRLASVDWMKKFLSNEFPQEWSCWIAQTLGSLGVFVPEMIRPLTFLFTNPKYTKADRDEALIYLAMIDMPQTAPVLVLAADLILKNNNPQDDYYPSRGLFGLLLLDDINVLAEQMLKNPPDTYMFPYAYGLAGSRNPQGRVLLEKMKNCSNERVCNAIENALRKSWVSNARSYVSVKATSPEKETSDAKTSIFEYFTDNAIKVIMLAQMESKRLGHNFVAPEMILLGLIGEGTGIAAKVLTSNKISLRDTRIEVEKIIGRGSGVVEEAIPFTPSSKHLMELSLEEARKRGHNYIGTEHLLLGLIRGEDKVGVKVLRNLGINLQRLKNLVLQAIA